MSATSNNPQPALDHPLVQRFVALIDDTFGAGCPRFDGLLDRAFMPFWKHLIILRYLPDEDDFVTVFFGSHVVRGFNQELTGKRLSACLEGEPLKRISEKHKRCLWNRERIYSSGDMRWQHRDYTTWCQVKMPLERNGAVNETLTFIVYE